MQKVKFWINEVTTNGLRVLDAEGNSFRFLSTKDKKLADVTASAKKLAKANEGFSVEVVEIALCGLADLPDLPSCKIPLADFRDLSISKGDLIEAEVQAVYQDVDEDDVPTSNYLKVDGFSPIGKVEFKKAIRRNILGGS